MTTDPETDPNLARVHAAVAEAIRWMSDATPAPRQPDMCRDHEGSSLQQAALDSRYSGCAGLATRHRRRRLYTALLRRKLVHDQYEAICWIYLR